MSAIFDKDPEEQKAAHQAIDQWVEKNMQEQEIPSGITANPDYDTMEPFLLGEQIPEIRPLSDVFKEQYVHSIALHLYAQEVSKPEPVNMPKPDYEQIAKDCVARAKETAPYLLQELGIVPTSVRQEET